MKQTEMTRDLLYIGVRRCDFNSLVVSSSLWHVWFLDSPCSHGTSFSLCLFQFFYRITTKQNCFKCPSFCSYHHFKIKAPAGTPFIIRLEDNEYDPYALACFIPSEMDSIPEALRMKVITSKSLRKSYTLHDVKGLQIGRVQYILNKTLHDMFQSGQISRMEG